MPNQEFAGADFNEFINIHNLPGNIYDAMVEFTRGHHRKSTGFIFGIKSIANPNILQEENGANALLAECFHLSPRLIMGQGVPKRFSQNSYQYFIDGKWQNWKEYTKSIPAKKFMAIISPYIEPYIQEMVKVIREGFHLVSPPRRRNWVDLITREAFAIEEDEEGYYSIVIKLTKKQVESLIPQEVKPKNTDYYEYYTSPIEVKMTMKKSRRPMVEEPVDTTAIV